jgi:C1q domain
LINNNCFAQLGIKETNTIPNAKAMLDVESTNKGVLIPRLSTTNRDAIVAPPAGLMIYNSTTNQFNYFNGSVWTDFAPGSFTLPYTGVGNVGGGNVLSITNTNSTNDSYAIKGISGSSFVAVTSPAGVLGESDGNIGVLALSNLGTGLNVRSNFGTAAIISNIQTANTNNALEVTTPGTGFAGHFQSTNSTVALRKALKTVGGIELTGIGEALDRTLTTDGSGTAIWAGPVGFAVSRTTDLAINNSSEIIIPFNSTQYDQGDNFITDRFTAPHDGLYHFDASINWTVNFPATNCYLSLRHNDTIGDQKRRAIQFVSSGGAEPFLSVSATFYMLGSETVDLRVYQNSGVAQNIESTASTYFSGFLVR